MISVIPPSAERKAVDHKAHAKQAQSEILKHARQVDIIGSTFQLMQPESGNIHVLDTSCCLVQCLRTRSAFSASSEVSGKAGRAGTGHERKHLRRAGYGGEPERAEAAKEGAEA